MTRIHLNGEGLPIPTEAMPEGLVAEGALAPVIFTPANGEDFLPADFIGLGYTHFEVMCVGAAGGRGGYSTYFKGGTYATDVISFGGGGGGGGMHIVAGLLVDLPEVCEVIVGQAGAHGAAGTLSTNESPIIPGLPGQDGGFSSFADDICRASGGMGGLPSPYETTVYPGQATAFVSIPKRPGGFGGQGGKGDRIIAGGGGNGGAFDRHEVPNPSPNPDDYDEVWTVDPANQGSWDGTIGEGGGGGPGGTIIRYDQHILYSAG